MNVYDMYVFADDVILQEKGKATATICHDVRGDDSPVHNNQYTVLSARNTVEYLSFHDALQRLALTNSEAKAHYEEVYG